MLRPQLFECPCAFHSSPVQNDRGVLTLPAPILLHPKEAEHSFWLWLISMKPIINVGAVVLDASRKPYSREFRSIFAAARFVCQFYLLPVPEHELKELCRSGVIVHLADSPVFLSDITSFNETKMLPSDFGQNAKCFGWKTSTNFIMPPFSRKRQKLAPPPSSPKRVSTSHAYDAKELGGKEDEVRAIIASQPEWNVEVIKELLHWGALPKLVEINHSFKDREFTLVNCTFAQPNGFLVKNVILPLGVLKMEYAAQTAHL